MSSREVKSSMQAVLNHLSGPMPTAPLQGVLTDEFSGKYIRTTWFNSCMYGQDHEGKWYLLYASVQYRHHVQEV